MNMIHHQNFYDLIFYLWWDKMTNGELNIVREYLVTKQYQKAKNLSASLLESNHLSAQLWVYLGESLELLGHKSQAWWAYERAWFLDAPATWAPQMCERLGPHRVNQPPEPWLATLLAAPKVSVAAAIIAKNEEEVIEETISRLLPAVDEIVVVDTGSTDSTAEIATKMGAKVYHFEWNDDFSAARNYALSKVKCDWVIFVDADEQLDKSDNDSVRLAAGLFNHLNPPAILRVVIISDSGAGNDVSYDITRLFPTRFGLQWWGRIHEQVRSPEGQPAIMYPHPMVRIRFYHSGYQPTVMEKKNKLQRNIKLLKQAVEEDPDDVTAWGFLGRELFYTNQIEEAVEAIKHTEQLAERFTYYGRMPEIWEFLIDALLRLDRVGEAIEVAKRAMNESPTFPNAWYGLGKTQIAQAVKLLKESIQSMQNAKTHAQSYRGPISCDHRIAQWMADASIADAYKLLTYWDTASLLYQKILEAVPENPSILRQLEHMDEQIQKLTQLNNKQLKDLS
jgi:tetratricopeptide (TPR) repeat protein